MSLSLEVDELLEECGRLHGHVCPGQLLGVRMALLGCELVHIVDPKGADRKKLFVWVEIDRCITDAVSAVTGVSLGRRTLKFVDYGKVAATFLNAETGAAVRVWARDDARGLADLRYPEITQKKERQMRAYSEARAEELFKVERVSLSVSEMDAPGHPKSRAVCRTCGEGVNDGRTVAGPDGSVLCRGCAYGTYYALGQGTEGRES
jgi:formylmethanofuran dehydrogenase subunit E